MTDYAKQREERIKAAKKRRRVEAASKAAAGVVIAVGAILLIAALVVISGLLTKFAWNSGVAPAAEAFGHDGVASISLLNGIALSLGVDVLGRLFRSNPVQLNAVSEQLKARHK